MLAERTVRRLSIRAPDDALARRAGFLIEDALRTASLPGNGAELLLIRRLRLPAFSATASPQQVALALEANCRPLVATTAGPTDDAALDDAQAVRFVDPLAAHLALTRLILLGAPRHAWCWPLAVPGYRPALSAGPALRTVALSLARLPEAPAALPRWLAVVVDTGGARETAARAFLAALEDQDVAVLARAVATVARQPSGGDIDAWARLTDWSARMFGDSSARHRWLVAVGASLGLAAGATPLPAGPAEPVPPCVSPTPADGRDQFAAQTKRAHDKSMHEAWADDAAVRLPAEEPESQPPGRQAPAELGPAQAGPPEDLRTIPQPPPTASGSADEVGATGRRSPAKRVGARAAAAAGPDGAVPTRAGGILFMLPLLEGLGLRRWLAEEEARAPVPQRLLGSVLQRLALTAEDPAWQLCGEEADAPDAPARADVQAWLRRCRRTLRLQVGIGVHDLVCRPARLKLTDTHTEIFFALDAVDLRLRRAGLDLDPGWVPWFARVVRFHYGRVQG